MVDNRFPLLCKYLKGYTYESIGNELGITRERVRQKLEREKTIFFQKNSYIKQRIKNILSRNGFFYSFRKVNRLFRLLKLMAKEERFKFSTLTVKRKRVFLVIPPGKKREELIDELALIKNETSLPMEMKEAYRLLKNKGFSAVLISLFFKLYDASLENGKVVQLKGLSIKENIELYVRGGSKLSVEEVSEVLSASRATVKKVLKELGVLKVKRREKGFNRNRLVAVNLTENEYRKIKRVSEELGYSISTLVRKELKKAGLI